LKEEKREFTLIASFSSLERRQNAVQIVVGVRCFLESEKA
jgi:hypothetical protein